MKHEDDAGADTDRVSPSSVERLRRQRDRARSELQETKEQFQQLQKLEALGLLTGGIAHDFNNLITVIRSYVDLVMGDLPSESQAIKDLEVVVQAADRATRLTRQLLAFSSRQSPTPRVLDINDSIGELAKMIRRLIGDGVAVSTTLEPHLPMVRIDPGHLDQVLLNLVVNARDAMDGEGTLTIVTRRRPRAGGVPDWVEVEVGDSGCGMDGETRRRLFEPFFSTKGDRGTGLGLSTVRNIVRQCGGKIRVSSRIGEGAKFHVRLPSCEATHRAYDSSVPPSVSPESCRVLVVDDDPYVRSAAARMLNRRGMTALVATGTEDALQVVRGDEGVDVILTDVIMPDLDGLALVAAACEHSPGLRRVFMSGYPSDDLERRGVKLAEDDVLLLKPFTENELLTAVSGAIGQA